MTFVDLALTPFRDPFPPQAQDHSGGHQAEEGSEFGSGTIVG